MALADSEMVDERQPGVDERLGVAAGSVPVVASEGRRPAKRRNATADASVGGKAAKPRKTAAQKQAAIKIPWRVLEWTPDDDEAMQSPYVQDKMGMEPENDKGALLSSVQTPMGRSSYWAYHACSATAVLHSSLLEEVLHQCDRCID
jgi:hypothetical protein